MPVLVKNLPVILFLWMFSVLGVALPSVAASVAKNNIAGKVIYVSDKLFAISQDQLTRSIKRGTSFSQGDTLKTSGLSSAQLRFMDDTVVVLRPETEFRIDAFSYATKADAQFQREASLFRGSLIEGSMRIITGDVGKKSTDGYWLNTPVATIFQVRDANYELVLGNAGLAVAVWEGTVTIENEGGSIVLGAGSDFSYALIAESTTLPQGLSNPPDLVKLNKKDRTEEVPGSGSSNVGASIGPGIERQGQQN